MPLDRHADATVRRRRLANLIFSLAPTANNLTIYNGASTEKSLRFMFYVALVGVPIVAAYTVTIYYVFRGKVTLTEESY